MTICAPVAERQVPPAGQLAEASDHLRGLGAELRGQRTGIRRPSGLGERAVHREPQVLTVHAAIFAKPDEYPGRPASVRVVRIFARAARSGQQEGDQPR